MSLADRIDALLPQTQCGRCLHPACRPYAEALANDEADLNQCAPGGTATIHALADLLNKPARPLNPECGTAADAILPRRFAVIDEANCIGCTLCIKACPVDAIIGAGKLMHTIISDECTGCELCLPPCPVDCIDMVDLTALATPAVNTDWTEEHAQRARTRYQQRQQRQQQRSKSNAAPSTKKEAKTTPITATKAAQTQADASDPRKAIIAAALARRQQKRQPTQHK